MPKEFLSPERLATQTTIRGIKTEINRFMDGTSLGSHGFRIGSAAEREQVQLIGSRTKSKDKTIILHSVSGLGLGENGFETKSAVTSFELVKNRTPLAKIAAGLGGESTLQLTLRNNPVSEEGAQLLLAKFKLIKPEDRYETEKMTITDKAIRDQLRESTQRLFATADEIPDYEFRHDITGSSVLGFPINKDTRVAFAQNKETNAITITFKTELSTTQYISTETDPLTVHIAPRNKVGTDIPPEFADPEQTTEAFTYLQRGFAKVTMDKFRRN